jgi:FHA domain-containing protein
VREIVIRVLEHRGSAMDDPPKATFGRGGGRIGRAEDNDLVLFDSDRMISRVHAEIVWRENGFYLVVRGGNPMQVSGAPLANGDETPLHVGDEIVIGPYRMRVDDVAGAAYVAAGVTPPPSAIDDPLGLGFGRAGGAPGPGAGGADPLGMDLFGSPAPPSPGAAPVAAGPPAATPAARGVVGQAPANRLPDDFDPFKDLFGAPPAAPAPSRAASPLPGSSEPRIDDLFGLGSAKSADPFSANPLFAVPTAADAGASDPLALFGGAAAAPSPQAPVHDHTPDIHAPFTPPVVRFDQAPPVAASPDATRVGDPASTPAPPPAGAAAAPAATPPPAAMRQASGGAPAAGATTAPPDELLAALLEGLGATDLAIPGGVSPELMRRIGVLLRESLGGTLDLLRARQSIKQEMRADMTMMSARGNNPLKFSPDVSVAISQMLNPRMRGFLEPEQAVREAFADLRSHEMGMMAGLRAALERLLGRFDPASLESRIEGRSLLGNLLAGSRKAQLWEAYTALYREISQESKEDFQSVLGRAFVDAYKEQSQRASDASEGDA